MTHIIDHALAENILELKEVCREIGAVEFHVIRETAHTWITAEYNGYDDIDTRRMRPAGLVFVARFTATDGGPAGFEIERVENGEEVRLFATRGNRV